MMNEKRFTVLIYALEGEILTKMTAYVRQKQRQRCTLIFSNQLEFPLLIHGFEGGERETGSFIYFFKNVLGEEEADIKLMLPSSSQS